MGVAKIARDKVIPAINASADGPVVAIASRSLEKAKQAATQFGIARVHGTYEDLLADPEVDAIYNPLPNHLHVPWSVRALDAGKHVLCEKPIALTAQEARALVSARDRSGRLVQEAVMVKTHPRWLGARDLIRAGRIGPLRAVTGFFSYHNAVAENVRNRADIGGGGLMDVGFYPITMSRFLFEAEPLRAMALLDHDPVFKTDRLSSAMLEFPGGHATFTVATQLVPYQSFEAFGTKGRLSLDTPWSMPAHRPSRILIDDGSHLLKDGAVSGDIGGGLTTVEFPACDQWQVQCESFGSAIRAGGPAPVPIEDAVATMRVMDALFRSTTSGKWESVEAD